MLAAPSYGEIQTDVRFLMESKTKIMPTRAKQIVVGREPAKAGG
jgi:hypothetical protein